VKKLIESLVQQIVDEPESVHIRESRRREGTEYIVVVAPNDVGKIIGKRGRIATAIRTVVSAVSQKERQDVHVKFETSE
jgi:predicted RNA-binding protein YlqC (UPF0109 family)